MNKENDDEVFLYSGAEPLNRDEITVMKSFFHANIFVPLSGNNLKEWKVMENERDGKSQLLSWFPTFLLFYY